MSFADRPSDVLSTLHRYFGHRDFRTGQEELVSTVLEGRDLLAVMPTGSGKSLGFQLPALLLPGVTLVVSPLISLMKDQVDELNRRGIRAAALHSQATSDARREALRAARLGELRLLYVAPERFASDFFGRFLRELPVARFVVDEAHCVSEWGHDFRPDYRRLRAAASDCRRSDGGTRPPVAAFTATATPEVRTDIVQLLGLEKPRVVVAGFDRPNITLRVKPVSGDTEKHQLLPQLIGSGRSLVYASTRRKAEESAETLQMTGVKAAAYHAGLSDGERTRVQDGFAGGRISVVCATNAFGMGIDRPDVEAVVHMDIPGSLEAYYQEIGRAGRDGRAAVATLLWNYADVKTREFLIDRGRDDLPDRKVELDPNEVLRRKDLERKKLRRMVAYADATDCLRRTILRYFGDPAAPSACGACGNCDRRQPLDEAGRLLVRKILSGIARAGERYGRRRITAMLVGAVDDLPEGLTALSTTGLLKGEEPRTIERWIDAACGAGLIDVSNDEYRTLRLTTRGRDVMAGRLTEVTMATPRAREAGRSTLKKRRRLKLQVFPSTASSPDRPGEHPAAALSNPAPEAVAALRAWRLEEARRRGIAPFIVLHDRTLLAIAAANPRSAEELLMVPGFGPGKLAEYGEGIVAVMRAVARPT
ncbi:MAG TPA: ATP-dependent DNA helicase RecQ [Vicinamibacterales bacterium]|nr:ATP-dependent DNA helicase RecQ [Vicinamibacterales bacterium]